MKRFAAVCFIGILAFNSIGCATAGRHKQTSAESLTVEQLRQLKDMAYSADIAYKFHDYLVAREYYEKIAALYPETKEACRARVMIKKINSKISK